jgi:hypothetical protein
MNQSAIQSVIISGNENRWIGLGLQGLQFTFLGFAGPTAPARPEADGGARKLPRFPPSDLWFGDYLYADCAISRGLMYRELCGVRAEQMRGAGLPPAGEVEGNCVNGTRRSTGPSGVPLGLCRTLISAQYRIAALGSQRSISWRNRR